MSAGDIVTGVIGIAILGALFFVLSTLNKPGRR